MTEDIKFCTSYCRIEVMGHTVDQRGYHNKMTNMTRILEAQFGYTQESSPKKNILLVRKL